MKKLLVILALCMVLSVVLVACNNNTNDPEETTPEVTTPEVTTPEATTPEETTPEATTPEETTPEATTPEETTPEETTPEETTEPEPDPADPVFFAGAADLAGIATAGAGIAGAEVVTEDGFEFARITVNSGDPQFTVGSNIGVVPQYLAFVYRTTAELDAEMFIGTSNGPNGTNDHVVLDWNNDGNWHILVVDLANCSSTNITDGNVGYFRLDPFRGATEGALDLAYIGFYNTAKYATDAFFSTIATIVPSADMASSIPGSPGVTSATMSADNTFITVDTMASSDPYYQLPMLNGKGIVANYVAIKYRTTCTNNTTSEIFVGSGGGPSGAGDNIQFQLTCDGKWQLAIVDLSQASAVVDNVVNYLRWDFFAGGSDATIDMAYIGLFASEADALAYDATVADLYVDTLNVPTSNWEVTGHKTGVQDSTDAMVSAGGVEFGALLHQGYIALGDINLAEMSKVVIYYGLDGSQTTIDLHAASANNRIILTSADQAMTNSPTDDVILASATYSELGWAVHAIEIDLTGVDYNGPVYVTYDTLPGTFMLISSVEFTYDPNYVEPEEVIEPIYYDGTNGAVTVPAGGKVQFAVRNAVGMNMIIEGAAALTVSADNTLGTVAPLTTVEGANIIQAVPASLDWGFFLLTIENTTDADAAINLTFTDPAAEENNNALALGENAVVVVVENYYCPGVDMTFTATEAGTYTFGGDAAFLWCIEKDEGFSTPWTVEMAEGETLTINVGVDDVMAIEGGNGEVTINLNITKA